MNALYLGQSTPNVPTITPIEETSPIEPLRRNSYSFDERLNQKSERYSCSQHLETFLLARATPSNSLTFQSQSSNLLPLVGILSPHTKVDQDGQDNWKISLKPFQPRHYSSYVHLPKIIRKYYNKQNDLIHSFQEAERLFQDFVDDENSNLSPNYDPWPAYFAAISLVINIGLMAIKAVAVHFSGSIAIVASLVDSTVDIVASLLILWTSSAMTHRNPYVYPQGRTRLEPVAVIILSVLMTLASIQLTVEALQQIFHLYQQTTSLPTVTLRTIVIFGIAIVAKFLLYLYSRKIRSRSVSVNALRMDHRNDVFSNSLAILCAYLGSKQAVLLTSQKNIKYLDPIGAIVMSVYILINWWTTGIEQIKTLTGLTATPQFLSKLTWICLNHHHLLQQVDTVRAFHFGQNFLVEVDIVLPQEMNIRESHDIGESLQHKLEKLDEVERAFVHLDYETTHDPLTEHKVV